MRWLGWARAVLVIGFSIAGSLLLATGAWAQVTFNVNSTDDGIDADVTDGKCEIPLPAAPGTCTLRAAVMQANRMANAGTIIVLPAGTYKLSIPATIAGGEENGDLDMIVPSGYSPGPTAITGAGAANTTIDAQGIDRILRIDAGRTVSISGVSMINGLLAASSDGGGIVNDGSLTLSDSIVSHNNAPTGSSSGGGIVNRGALVATRVTFNDNHAGEFGNGGGIANVNHGSVNLSQSTLSVNTTGGNGGAVSNASTGGFTADKSTFADNTAASQGGGIYSSFGSSLTMTGSTISGNKAANGGGVYNAALLYARNSTIGGNTSTQNGGGVYNVFPGNGNFYNSTIAFNQADTVGNAGQGGGVFVDLTNSGSILAVRNTVIAGNTHSVSAIDDDCNGAVGFYSKNKVGTFSGCSFAAGSTGTVTFVVSLAEFGPLQNNGGPTSTRALVPPSDMINGGLGCVNQNSEHLATDQRGRPRPPSPPDPFNSTCDIGAFEYNEIFPGGFESTL